MAESGLTVSKGEFAGTVCSHRRIGERFYRLGLEFSGTGAAAFAKTKPGQFAQIDLGGTPLPAAEAIPDELADAAERKILLRRPFSFFDVSAAGDRTRVEILYSTLGPATLRMTSLKAGGSVSVIGPLGRGFSVPEGKKTAVLVVGGMGAGPLVHLAKVLTAEHPDIYVIAFAGAKTKKELPFEKLLDAISQGLGFSVREFARYGIKSQTATDDGSMGHEGPVTDCLSEWLVRHSRTVKDMIIYACGPEAMLAKVAEIAKGKNVDCQVSMERMMACGFGVCQSCAVQCKVNGSESSIYKLCCKDGPVFDAKEVAFSIKGKDKS